MSQPPWNLDIKSLSHQQLVEILRNLQDTQHIEIVRDLRNELIARLRTRGFDTTAIIRRLSYAVPRGTKLSEIATDWAESLGVTAAEFKRIADAK